MGEMRVDLLETVGILEKHLTPSLCEKTYETHRTSERRRLWTLQAMAQFWTQVILRAPSSLRQALEEAYRGSGGFPHVEATPQAFFERSRGLHWEFFAELLKGFTKSVLADAPRAFEKDLQKTLREFPEVLVVDGSRLDAVAHRLKVLWDERIVTLPGSILVLYDLFRGIARRVHFCEDAVRGEVPLLQETLKEIAPGTLLLADRAYCSHQLFGELSELKLFAVVRCTKAISLERVEVLEHPGQPLDGIRDEIVLAGTPQKPSERQRLRRIRWRKGKKTLSLLTNVLDPKRLSAKTAIALYRRRWKIERMFYDLKEVLDLHRFYAANVNAVAMQVHAAAMVYVAMRVAQARIAQEHDLAPEQLSVEKLFPRVAAAAYAYVISRLSFLAIVRANPGVRVVEPDWSQEDFAWTTLRAILVEPRNPRRRRRRNCAAQRKYASLHKYARS